MRRLLPYGTSIAVLTTAALLLAGPVGAAAPDGAHTDAKASSTPRVKVPTRFALSAAGFGTEVEGGQLPVDSGTTGYTRIGCTNKAGLLHKNYIADVVVPGLGTISGVKTKAWTHLNAKKHEVSSNSLHNVAKVDLGDGALVITAVSSFARVWHDGAGFHTKTVTSIGAIKAGGQSFPIPTPDQPLTIPGLATISIGDHHKRQDQDGAYAAANAVKIVLIPSQTIVRIAHSAALMGSGITYGRFHGQSNGTQVRALDDNVRSGPNPLSWMPCQGTKGEVLTKANASINLADQIVVGAVENKQMGRQNQKKTTGFEQSTIAEVNLGDGQLVIDAIKARANVTRYKSGRVVKDANGTTIGSITGGGNTYPIPDPGQSLEIPGLVRLEANVITKTKRGIDVVAVRLTLLDGTGAVVDLGHAFLEIKPSGRHIG